MNNREDTIMVVDDTPANLRLLEQMLGEQYHRVLTFPRGALALKAAISNPPDLILLDINMPEMNGFELCRHLKLNDTLKDVPVIFISANSDTDNKLKAFSMGGVDYVTKPFQVEEVNARIKTHLRLSYLQKKLECRNSDLKEIVREKVRELSESQLATTFALTKLAESRDDDTGQHIERTRNFCRLLAERLRQHPDYCNRISKAFIESIYHCAPMHDIGKVAIPDHILLKPGKLTADEFDVMKTHAEIGADTLEGVRANYPQNMFVTMGVEIARCHHEKWDGSGYPAGLRGEDIPLSARIMALADVYDALRAQRPYKSPFSHAKSCEIIMADSGTHFDPVIGGTFKLCCDEFDTILQQFSV